MKALVYNGPRNVSVSDVPDPKIGRPTDAIVQITRTNICGSDLHMYEGRTDMETGRVLGHENLGRVMEVGPAVQPRIMRFPRRDRAWRVDSGRGAQPARGSHGLRSGSGREDQVVGLAVELGPG